MSSPWSSSPLRSVAALFVVSLLTGCRSNPCSDKNATAPASLTDVAASLPDSSVCSATGSTRAMMGVWGEESELRKKILTLRVGMKARGWSEQPATGWDAKWRESFVKGDDTISVTFAPGSMASFGSKIQRAGAYVHVSHSKVPARTSR
jgi:hypothetical protein